MKASLSFEFEIPEEREEYETVVQAADWKAAALDMDRWLRDQIKYLGKTQYQQVRDKLLVILDERGLKV
jgi:hypothetical protein